MKIFVELRDHEDQLHKEFQWIVTGKGEIAHLREQIKLAFSIENVFQQLSYNGATIRSDTLKEAGMMDNDTCVVIRFDDKLGGVHSGRLCTVTDHDETTIYHIKTNYGGPKKSSSRSGRPPNLREVFGYSLLQLIGVGPESHFFCPPPGKSTRTIFIATKSIPNFESNRMDKLTKSKNIKNILIEIHVLCSIFCITDVHQDNCGQLDGKTIIIDFAIPFRESYERENVCQLVCEGTPAPVDTLVNGVANAELRKVVEACSSDERMKIARAALDKWNLMDAIESAKVRTKVMKEIMVGQGIRIEKTENFSQYVADVKYNCSLFL